MIKTRSSFIKVQCTDCENEQVIFDKATTPVMCHVCGANLAMPTGGKAKLKGKVLETME
ncbi:MAG: 30S ribosomal protein S27e [Euryarchaeota archaeon]|nr:30S ribosomal protein S27e [Euryarchaeota archaeon]